MSYRLHVPAKAKATAHRASSPFESLHPLASCIRRTCSRHLVAASIIPLLAAAVASPAHATYPGENGVIVVVSSTVIGSSPNFTTVDVLKTVHQDGTVGQLGWGTQPSVSPN